MFQGPKESTGFPATQWDLVSAAGGRERDSAWSRLYTTYWTPLCAQARRFGVPENDVEDAIQELFMNLFTSGTMERADRHRGRFRSYLLGALRNHLSHRRAREHALKRGGWKTEMPTAAALTPTAPEDELEFDAAWAGALFGQALRRFCREERHSVDSRSSWALLEPYVLGEAEQSQECAARQLGITAAAVKTRVFRLRHRFREIVREEVRRTVASDADCDDELRYLSVVLAKSGDLPAFPEAM